MAIKKTSKKLFFGENFGIVNCQKDTSIPNGYEINRTLSEWSVVFLISGNIKIKNIKHTLSENDIYFFPPNSRQDLSFHNNASAYWITLSGNKIDKILEQLKIPVMTICSIKNPEIVTLLDNLVKEYLLKNLFFEEISLLYIKSFFYMLSRELTVKISVNQNLIKDVILAMYSNPHITNEECAKLCLMSKDHFIRIFKLACGITPLQFKKNIIISRAKNLLLKTNLSITSIAESSGFTEYPLYFNRFFKQATGYYPSKYRELFANVSTNEHPSK